MTTATTAAEERLSFKDVNQAIAALRAAVVDPTVDPDEDEGFRRRFAGSWVVVHGTIYDHFTEPNLAAWQHCDDGNTAWSMVGHWSVQRGDGLDREPVSFPGHREQCATCAYLEEILALSSDLKKTVEDCETCGGDIDDHIFGPEIEDDPDDPEGEIVHWDKVTVSCEEPWTRLDSLLEEPGTIAPEQVSEARTARWVAPLINGQFALVFSSYYVSSRPIPEPGIAPVLVPSRFLVRYDYYVVCSDPDNYKATAVIDAEEWVNVDSDDPEGEDLIELVDDAELEHGEFHDQLPDAAAFSWK